MIELVEMGDNCRPMAPFPPDHRPDPDDDNDSNSNNSCTNSNSSNCRMDDMAPAMKRPRTSNDFLEFCDMVLSYTNYPAILEQEQGGGGGYVNGKQIKEERLEEMEEPPQSPLRCPISNRGVDKERRPINDRRKLQSPLNSVGESARGSTRSSTSSTQSDSSLDVDIETPEFDDSWGMVTCWCGKPFAGRPMIECENCLTWLHLSCARVRKSNIPKHFKCGVCKKPRRKSANSQKRPAKSVKSSSSSGGQKRSRHSSGVDDEKDLNIYNNNRAVEKSSEGSAGHSSLEMQLS